MRAVFSGILLITFLLSGCVGFKPADDPTRFYLLTSPASTLPSEWAKDGLRIGIRRIVMPEYLHPSKIAVRKGDYEIVYSDFNRWGEEVNVAVSRSLLQTLTQELNARYVSIFPWPSEQDHDYLVRVAFTSFEGTAEGEVLIAGQWSIIHPTTRDVLQTHSFERKGSWQPRRFETLAESLSQLLSEVGSDLAAAIEKVHAASGQADRS